MFLNNGLNIFSFMQIKKYIPREQTRDPVNGAHQSKGKFIFNLTALDCSNPIHTRLNSICA